MEDLPKAVNDKEKKKKRLYLIEFKTRYIVYPVSIDSVIIIDWLNLTGCQPVWGYFKPIYKGITLIVR